MIKGTTASTLKKRKPRKLKPRTTKPIGKKVTQTTKTQRQTQKTQTETQKPQQTQTQVVNVYTQPPRQRRTAPQKVSQPQVSSQPTFIIQSQPTYSYSSDPFKKGLVETAQENKEIKGGSLGTSPQGLAALTSPIKQQDKKTEDKQKQEKKVQEKLLKLEKKQEQLQNLIDNNQTQRKIQNMQAAVREAEINLLDAKRKLEELD